MSPVTITMLQLFLWNDVKKDQVFLMEITQKVDIPGGHSLYRQYGDVRTIWVGLFSMKICRKWVYFTICRPGFKIIHQKEL